MPKHNELPIRVINPKRLPAWSIPAARLPIGDGYKPSLAMMPDGTLVMLAMVAGPPDEKLPDGKVHEWTGIYRSDDGGQTWSAMRRLEDMIGREQWLTCTTGGILFASSHMLIPDTHNDTDHIISFLHRSTDGGQTWQRTRATIDGDMRCGAPEKTGSNVGRNVVEMPDGTLLFGVSATNSNVAYLWRSTDRGETWDRSLRVDIRGFYDNYDGFFAEDWTYLNDSGALLHWIRVGHPSPMAFMNDSRPDPTNGNDNNDRTMWTRSTDGGKTWSRVTNFSNYGQMYPRVTKLHDGRLLMTLTRRALFNPLGLRAVLSYDDGDTWDLDRDHLVIEGFTPWGLNSGGGFGNSVQLADGTLVSCYSYRPDEQSTQLEIVRWKLP